LSAKNTLQLKEVKVKARKSSLQWRIAGSALRSCIFRTYEMKYLLDNENTERMHFRKIESADFDQWLEFFKDPASFRYWNAELQTPEIECKKWYEKQTNRYANDLGGMNALTEKATGKLIGHCGLLVQTVDGITELEIAYSLLAPYRGKGFAFEAAKKCKDHAFEKEFSDSLISIISLTNIPSARVAMKNGMLADKQTLYNQNPVNIFRVRIQDWKK
jgi:[ribosomal protein S5]-alanine N-acetyltransferase